MCSSDNCIYRWGHLGNVYEGIWAAALGEQIGCIRESLNAMDRYAVALKKDDAVIGHLPQKNTANLLAVYQKRKNN